MVFLSVLNIDNVDLHTDTDNCTVKLVVAAVQHHIASVVKLVKTVTCANEGVVCIRGGGGEKTRGEGVAGI